MTVRLLPLVGILNGVKSNRHRRSESPVLSAGETAEWYRFTPQKRFVESQRLWANFLALGGTCDPEPDSQSPFYVPAEKGPGAAHGRPGLHPVRRRRVHP